MKLMKKYFYSMLAATGLLLATSCSQEKELVDITGDESRTVTLSVKLPGQVESRTVNGKKIGDGTKATELIFAMYEKGGSEVLISKDTESGDAGIARADDGTFTVSVPMAKDLEYDLLFLAYNKGNCAFQIDATDPSNTNLKALKMNTTLKANVDEFDAFVGKETMGVNAEAQTTIYLKRPFAQVNAATTLQDLKDAKTLKAEVAYSNLVIKKVPDTYNVYDGVASGEANFTYESNFVLKCDNATEYPQNEKITVAGAEYYYLTLAYVLAGGVEEESTHEATFQFIRRDDNKVVSSMTITNLPIQRNYRTNVVGNLLTRNENYKIVIDEEFNPEDKNIYVGDLQAPEYNATSNTYYITNPAQLAWVAAATNGLERPVAVPTSRTATTESDFHNFQGETILLEADIDLGNYAWTPIGLLGNRYTNGFKGTFNGQNHTISNLSVDSKESAGLFANMHGGTIKNLKVKNVDIQSNHYAGAILAWSESSASVNIIDNCHVEDGKIVVTPALENGVYTDGDKVGGIVGYSYKNNINNCSVKNLEISAYNYVGGIVGYDNQGSEIKNNSVYETKIIADQTTHYPYDVNEGTHAGEIYGYATSHEKHENNIDEDVEVVKDGSDVIKKITNANELKQAINDAQNGAVLILEDGTYTGLFQIMNKQLTIRALNEGKAIIDGKIAIANSSTIVTLEDLVLTDVNPQSVESSAHQYLAKTAKSILGAYDATFIVKNCVVNITQPDNRGMWMQEGGNAEPTIVSNTIFNCNGNRPITYKANITIDGCTFNQQYRYAVQIWGADNDGTEKVVFTNNRIVNPNEEKEFAAGISVSGSYSLSNVMIEVANNTLESNKFSELFYTYELPTKEGLVVDMESCTITGATFILEEEVKNTILISNKEELVAFAEDVNNGNSYADKYVMLTTDIDLNNVEWTPIGGANGGKDSYKNNFAGVFNGNGKTIKNLKVTESTKCAGLFSTMCSGTIKNLTIDGVTLKTNHFAGAVLAWGETGAKSIIVDNCHVKNAVVTVIPDAKGDTFDNGDKAGGVVGWIHYGTISNCTAENIEITAYRDLGGIVGYVKNTIVENNKVNGAKITVDQVTNFYEVKTANAGPIIGRRDATPVENNNVYENVTFETLTKPDGDFDTPVEGGDF